MAVKLFYCHVARGWDKRIIREYILNAHSKLKSTGPTPTRAPKLELTIKERLFLHMECHSTDIPKRRVRSLYDAYCKAVFESTLAVKQFTIAYSHPKNLQDILTQAKLHQAPGKEASKYY